jgi:hypothetical protein
LPKPQTGLIAATSPRIESIPTFQKKKKVIPEAEEMLKKTNF